MNINSVITNANSIAISGHVRPDGDCVGSCLGLYNYIKTWYKDKKVDVLLDPIAEKFQILKRADEIKHECDKAANYDTFIYLDCGDPDRIGCGSELYNNVKEVYCIDHHISNKLVGEHVYIRHDASSTSELVYELLDKDKITKEIAECLFVGIVHDTGVFQYSNTSGATLHAVQELKKTGIDSTLLIEDTFYVKTYEQNQILGRALIESIRLLDNCCIASVITKKQMDFYGVTPLDLDGVVSILKQTKDIDVAILIYELTPHEFKVSLRASDRIDVSAIASYYGGGGHKKAAGCTVQGTAHDVLSNILKQIEKQL